MITNGGDGTIQIKAGGNLTISDPSAGTVKEVDIADNAIYVLDAKGQNVNLFQNGEKIVFQGANSELDLINSVTNAGSFTLNASLNPSANAPEGQGDGYGIIGMNAVTNSTLTITSNNGTFTIGQDDTHRLQNLKLTGGNNSNIIIDDTITIYSQLISMGSTGKVTFGNPLISNITFTADGTIVINGLTGNVTNSNPGQGTLTINSGNVSGAIGINGSSLKLVNIGANLVTISNNVFAPIVLTDKASSLTVGDGAAITGTVKTTAGDGSGKLIFIEDGTVTGNVGENGASLAEIVFNGVNNLRGTANARVFTVNTISDATIMKNATGNAVYTGAGKLTSIGNFTGNVDFKNQTGIFTLGNSSTLTGNVTSSNSVNGSGTLNIMGNGTVTGEISDLDLLQYSGGNGQTLNLQSNVVTNQIVFVSDDDASGTIDAGGALTVNDNVVFNDKNNSGGTLAINGASTIGAITNGGSGTIQIKAGGSLTINDPSAGTVKEVDIANNATYALDAKGGNVNLFQNGAKIVFQGANSELDLINSLVNAGSFTLFANLNPYNDAPEDQGDGYGIIGMNAVENGTLTITSNGGPFTIGQDATHRIQNLKLTGGDNSSIIIDDTMTIYTQLVTMGSTGKVTFGNPLISNITFTADGTIVINGLSGNVTTSENGQGILTINGGGVSGTIGDADNSLKLVNIGANPVTFSANVFAPVMLTDNASQLTLGNNVTVTGAVKTKNNGQGILTLGTKSSVTDGIGDEDASLAQVKLGAGASSLGGNVYSVEVALTDDTSALTLLNNGVINGSITNGTGEDGNGKLIFAQDGTVAENAGAEDAALVEVVFNGADNIGGNVNATILTVNGGADAKITGTTTTGNAIYAGACKLTSIGNFTGNVDFKNQTGIFTLGNGSTLTGNVTSSNSVNGSGTLNIMGNGTVTGEISDLDLLQYSGGNGQTLNLQSNVVTNQIVFVSDDDASGTIDAGGALTVNDNVVFNDKNNSGGTLAINGASTIGAITNGGSGTIQIKAGGSLTINDPSAGTVKEVDIANNATYALDAKGGNVNLFQNGAKIVFQGANSELDLINSLVNAGSFTLFANLNPYNDAPEDQGDGYGIIGMNAVTNGTLTITSNGGPFTIGQDATHRIQNLKLTGGDNSSIVIDDTMTIYTQLVTMGSTGKVTFGNPLTSNITFTADGTIVISGLTGNVTTSQNGQGILTINGGGVSGTIGDADNSLKLVNIGANPVTFSANVFAPVMLTNNASQLTLGDNVTVTGSVTTANDKNGILTLGKNSNVTGAIGKERATLQQVNIGAGASSFTQTVYAGKVELTDETSELTLQDDVIVYGDVTTTAGNGTGKLIFAENGTVAGSAGAEDAALAEIVFNSGISSIDGTANATNFTVAGAKTNANITGAAVGNIVYDAAGILAIETSLKGDVNYQDNAGTLVLYDKATLTGTVNSNEGIDSTLQVVGNSTISGNINNLGILEFAGVQGQTLNLNGNSTINNVIFVNNAAPSGTINVNAGLNAGKVTFNKGVGNENGGILVINVASTVGTVINPDNGTIIVNADFTITDPNAGNINEIDIKNGTTYTIDAVNNNINLLHDDNKIVFEGPTSTLALVNSSDVNDRTFTLFANLNALNADGDTQDNYGIVKVATNVKDLTIANNGDDIFTIGQDATHRLQNFIIDNVGEIEDVIGSIQIDSTVFAKLITMHSLGQATFTQPLNLGNDGNIYFTADGTIVINGLTGNVTTSQNGQGILTINGGGVSGTIGDADNNLKLVNIEANPVTFSANVFAPVVLNDNASQLTLGNNVKVTGSVTTANDKKGILTLGADSSVTGGIGTDKASLAEVNLGAGASSLGGDVYSVEVALTDNTSALTLLNNGVINGSVTNETGIDGSGKLIFEGDGKITENAGAEDAALAEIEFNGKNTIGGTANATTLTVNANANATITGATTGNAVYAGAGALTTGDYTGNIDFKGQGGVFSLSNGSTLTGSAISTVRTSGTFIFAGDGTVTQNLGIDGAAIAEVIFNGTDTVKSVNATTLTVNATADATITGATTGNAVYAGAGILTTGDYTGNIDFKGKSGVFSLSNGSTIDGSVTSTGGVTGTLNFAGKGEVTKAIGTDVKNSPALISVQGDNATTVTLDDDVIVGGVEFTNGGILDLKGNLTTPNIDFGANGGTLELKGANVYNLNSTIAGGVNSVLNLFSSLIATNGSIGSIDTVNVGSAATPQTYTIQVDNANLAVNSNINLLNADSQLTIIAAKDQTVIFGNNIVGTDGGGGIVNLDGNGKNLTIDGKNGAAFGAINALTALNTTGNVTITKNLDVHNINELNIKTGGNFTDQSLTSALIANINIGEAGDNGAATYGLDAVGRDFNLNTAKMTFLNADSTLNLENSSAAADSTITLTGPLDVGEDQFGIVQLTTGDKNLTIDDGGKNYSLGTADHRLKQLSFVSTGNGTIDLNVGINVEKIVLGVNTIELDEVNADVYFTKATIYSATGNINGNVDFQNNNGVINLANGLQINGTVKSTGGVAGTLNFAGDGQVAGLITNIAMLQAGAGNVSLTASGNYTIGEIQGNGNNNLTFAKDTNLTGGINKTGGQAVNLIFTNGGGVSDAVGLNAAVGNITVQAGTVNFGSTVKSGNIILSNGATMQVYSNVTATDISGDNDNNGTLKLNNAVPIIITGTVGTNNILNTIEVANSDATVTGNINTQNINFSNAGVPATLTLQGATNVTNVATAGNNIHTIAVTDLTANGNIGTAANRLKTVELTGNGLVNINTNNFYSGVSTANNNQGNAKLNVDGSIVYDLGSDIASLASVQFSGNSTVKGDVYSMDMTLDAGKNVTFDRGDNNLNPKILNVPDAIVDGALLPRSLQVFTYLTDVKSQSFNFTDATSSAEFKDAVVLDTPIDNGSTIKFNKNVWLKREITNAQNIEFSPNSFAILEKNIKIANLIADQATLILINDIIIDANLNVRDAVLDLANYELKHTGNVTHNGSLTVITYYDTTLKTGGHVLVGNGASVDMSGVDNVIIKIKSRSDITKIANGDRHQVVQLEAGATFTPAPQNNVAIDNEGEQNRFVKWVSDPTGLTLIADDGTGGGGGDNTGGDNTGGGSGGGGDNTGGGGGSGDNTGGGGTGGGGNNTGDGGGSDGGGTGTGGGIGTKPVLDPSEMMNDTKGSTVATGVATQLMNSVTEFGNNTDAGKLMNDLGLMPSSDVAETLERLGERTETSEISEELGEFNNLELGDILTDVAVNMDNLTSEGIFGRLDELGNDDNGLNGLNEPASTLNNNNASGRRRTIQPQAAAAAGDEDNIGTGVWGVPFYGIATQKSKNGASGYKSKTGGGIIGADYAIGDTIILGAAYTRAESKLRHRNDKSGDKTKASSNVFSVYGLYNWLQNNLFAEFIGSYGVSHIKNKEKRMTSTGNQNAIGKIKNTSYSGEILGGYNFLMNHLSTVTPMLGVRYSNFKNSGYKETGTTFQNLSVRKNSYNKFEGIIGLKGVTNFLANGVLLKPELHGFINYDFKGKLPNIQAYLDGIDQPLATVKFKPAKVLYNLGGGISTKYNMVEFGVRYNLSLAKKYIANQGSIKIKVNL